MTSTRFSFPLSLTRDEKLWFGSDYRDSVHLFPFLEQRCVFYLRQTCSPFPPLGPGNRLPERTAALFRAGRPDPPPSPPGRAFFCRSPIAPLRDPSSPIYAKGHPPARFDSPLPFFPTAAPVIHFFSSLGFRQGLPLSAQLMELPQIPRSFRKASLSLSALERLAFP